LELITLTDEENDNTQNTVSYQLMFKCNTIRFLYTTVQQSHYGLRYCLSGTRCAYESFMNVR